MVGYDIDGVITAGVIPSPAGVIITGRSYEEAPETITRLRRLGVFNAVYFNPVPFTEKSLEQAGEWKATMINLLHVTTFYEDDPVQVAIIRERTQCDVVPVG
jgi:hypothetical protein